MARDATWSGIKLPDGMSHGGAAQFGESLASGGGEPLGFTPDDGIVVVFAAPLDEDATSDTPVDEEEEDEDDEEDDESPGIARTRIELERRNHTNRRRGRMMTPGVRVEMRDIPHRCPNG